MTDWEVCSTLRFTSEKEDVEAEFLAGKELVAAEAAGVLVVEGISMFEASWYSSEVSEALETRVSLKETSSTAC